MRRRIMSTTLTPWQPSFGLIEPFRQELEDVMERFFGENGGLRAVQTWAPRVDVEEADKEILIKADLPGVDPKNVEITVENGVLTVRGEKKEEQEQKKKNYYRLERFAGTFHRAIQLPPGADAEKVTATSSNGVVTITIPKKAEAQPKRVAIAPKG
jgi:HSP20 family protein